MSVRILEGDALTVLKTLPDQSVQCCVTSPPYFGLRDYGVSGQLGLEKTPQLYVDAMVGVFSEVKRVLRDDGTLWLNIGDSYARGFGGGTPGKKSATNRGSYEGRKARVVDATSKQATNRSADLDAVTGGALPPGCKSKDLIGVPWMLAFALRADGWYLRSDIIWHKPNPMPESVTDRPTKSHEYLFLLTKSSTYYYDAEAILEPVSPNTNMRVSQNVAARIGSERANGGGKTNGNMKAVVRGAVNPKAALNAAGSKQNESFSQAVSLPVLQRNKRSVWSVTTQGYSEAHFATFPPKLIEPCILAGTAKGQTVLDPFGGAGTTGLVADRLGRDALLIELNPKYAEMARKRIHSDNPLFGDVA